LAILLALASPGLEVLGITTVAGNAGIENTTRNALRVLTLAGRPDVPAARGGVRHRARGADARGPARRARPPRPGAVDPRPGPRRVRAGRRRPPRAGR